MGVMKHESLGDIEFKDEKNGLSCIIKIGSESVYKK